MPDTNTVSVTFQFDPETAVALDDPAIRARIERLIRRTVRPTGIEQLFVAMDALSDEARRRGLTDEILEEELVAHDAGRRTSPPGA